MLVPTTSDGGEVCGASASKLLLVLLSSRYICHVLQLPAKNVKNASHVLPPFTLDAAELSCLPRSCAAAVLPIARFELLPQLGIDAQAVMLAELTRLRVQAVTEVLARHDIATAEEWRRAKLAAARLQARACGMRARRLLARAKAAHAAAARARAQAPPLATAVQHVHVVGHTVHTSPLCAMRAVEQRPRDKSP